MPLMYHVGEHDGGYAYRVNDVWSEPFPDHATALAAAKAASLRQQLGGEDAEITFETADGHWQSEHVSGGDRPETEVIDTIPRGEQASDVDTLADNPSMATDISERK
jgi:hypothetical protein